MDHAAERTCDLLLVAGSVLRIWPMFVLRRRFSGLVAIQPGHELATEGAYRYVRHPIYAAVMLSFVPLLLGRFSWGLLLLTTVLLRRRSVTGRSRRLVH